MATNTMGTMYGGGTPTMQATPPTMQARPAPQVPNYPVTGRPNPMTPVGAMPPRPPPQAMPQRPASDAPQGPLMGTPPARVNPVQRDQAVGRIAEMAYGGPAPPQRPRYNPKQYRPPARWGGGRPLNWQQQQMRNMPPGMRQAYNNRPMTQQRPNVRPMAPPTMRGRPAASRVNLQGNQLNRFRY